MDLGQTIDAWTKPLMLDHEKRRTLLTFATEAPPAAMLLNMIAYSLILASKSCILIEAARLRYMR